jgi:hypothetical protein
MNNHLAILAIHPVIFILMLPLSGTTFIPDN